MGHLSVGTRINRLSSCAVLHVLAAFRFAHVHSPQEFPAAPNATGAYITQRGRCAALWLPPGNRTCRQFEARCGATLIGLLYATGLRIGEALKLTLADVDMKRRLLLIRETKFKKTRYVPCR